jgi:ubiquinone/menaquinone biosynthesis C-methylase UbiE
MHSFARHHDSRSDEASIKKTKGLVLKGGWRYDLHGWLTDIFVFRGQVRELRQKTVKLAQLQLREAALDVGCGTGTLALEVARRMGRAGRVAGVDPGTEQVACARAKAARRRLPIEFQVGVVEQLPFPDRSFDVVFSTLMMHHLPAPLKRQGLAEIARVLKPSGRLVLADFTHQSDRRGQAARFHAGGSRTHDLVALLKEAGFDQMETEEMQPRRFSAFPGAGIVRAYKSEARREPEEIHLLS